MKKKILIGILSLIIILGIVLFFVHGFNVGTIYGSYTKIGVYNQTGLNKAEMTDISKEIFENKKVVVQNVEYFEQMVLITISGEVEDSDIEELATKVNEKYSIEITKDDLNIVSMPGMSVYEIIKPYVLLICIAIVIMLIYIVIRYHSLGLLKMLGISLLFILVTELVIMSIYLIFNIMIDKSIIPVMLLGLGLGMIFNIHLNDKKMEIINIEKAKKSKKNNVE